MSAPEFEHYEDVTKFLHTGGDAWHYNMADDYMDMIAGDLSVEETDI